MEELLLQNPTTWKGHLHNQFEDHLFEKHLELANIKNALYKQGAVYAAMSGSGSTMYGLFKEKPNHTWCPAHYLCKVITL
jgi:4-diphosphocytidyl-2-C-methyl-D-erythritol kinase